MIVDDWEVQIEDKPSKADRIGHEISDDYDRETSVIEQVLAAAVKRREEISKKQGGNQYGGQVSLCALNVLEIQVSNLSTIDETGGCALKEGLLSGVYPMSEFHSLYSNVPNIDNGVRKPQQLSTMYCAV